MKTGYSKPLFAALGYFNPLPPKYIYLPRLAAFFLPFSDQRSFRADFHASAFAGREAI
jgi:hypothetical protein